MSTEVIVAIVAATAAVVAPILAWFAARQDANDLRKNINRDIDLLHRIKRDSTVGLQLESHIATSIENLMYRDGTRREIRRRMRMLAFPYTLVLAAFVIGMIIEPDRLNHTYFRLLSWLLYGMAALWCGDILFSMWRRKRKARSSEAEAGPAPSE